jgi:Acetyltransferase (GNAT) domain
MARFERVDLDAREWNDTLSTFADRIVFQTPAWISFLAEAQRGEPVLAALREGREILGYVTGLIVRRFGLKIFGSPFRGWSTPYMGFNLRPSVPRRVAVHALTEFAFSQLRCAHFELTDMHMALSDVLELGLAHMTHPTIEIDLTQSEEALFANMDSACRRNIRKAEKSGVVIEEAQDMNFAEDLAAQLRDVYAKQGLVPHFGAERVHALINHVHPTGMVLLLRARDAEGRCIATGIYPGLNQVAFYNWGASWRQYQHLRPNELLHWYAMRYWKRRGLSTYNMEGTKPFKQKFGGFETAVPMIYNSKYRLLSRLRSSALPIARTVLHVAWRLKSLTGREMTIG